MIIMLDLRYNLKSGASTYIDNIVPEIMNSTTQHYFCFYETYKQSFPFDSEAVKVIRSPCNPFLRTLYDFLFLPATIRSNNIELYHGMKFPGIPNLPCKQVSTLHSATLSDLDGHFELPKSTRVFYQLLGNRSLKKSNFVISVSNYLNDYGQHVLSIPSNKIKTIYHGCSEEFRKLGESDTAPVIKKYRLPKDYILCVGNITPVKNFKIVVQAFSRLKDEIKENLVIAGSLQHSYAKDLLRFVKENGLMERIFFPGFLNRMDLSAVMNNAAVMIMPSLSEGLGFSFIESMSCGVPIIASKRGGLKELGEGVALTLDDPSNTDELARLIMDVLAFPQLRQDMSSRSIQKAKSFSWKLAAEEHLRVYDSLV